MLLLWISVPLIALRLVWVHWLLLYGLALLAAVQVLWTVKNWRLYKLCNRIPGPRFVPLVGNFFTILSHNLDFINMTYKFRERYGHIYRVWFGHLVYIGLSQAKDVETIMSSHKFIDKSRDYSNLHPWLGTGLLTSTGSKWQYRRKLITPTFHFRILDRFMESFNRNSRVLVDRMGQEVGRPAFDIHHYISLCTLDIICESAMGTEVHAQLESESAYVKAVNSMCWLLYYRGIRPWLRIPFVFNRTQNGKMYNKYLETLHDMSKGVIKKRKQEYMSDLKSARIKESVRQLDENANRKRRDSGVMDGDENKAEDEEDVCYGQKKREAFLDHLLKLSAEGENLTDDDIREEVDTIMFEGHDTTGAALSFALFSLATNQHVQEQLHEELRSIFGGSNRDATIEDLQDMKYMERVIKETLRLYPSVPLFWRDVREEVTLGSGYTVPAGATVALNIFMLGRNPDAFEDPEQFDPDRFLPENWEGKHPFDYTPFSAGPRNCVGQKFAMMEMKVALARVVRSYSLLPPPQSFSLDLAVEVVLKSRSGVKLRVERRPQQEHSVA